MKMKAVERKNKSSDVYEENNLTGVSPIELMLG